ncbi:SusC/RagA family TonB-linked outer membrane protein [Algivirga pacifica]|uniref:SusC/RagA family TonB-linked outer membrane protein n=1 Tax=Algivirga pacifica TaxID=1162670 RepID=A0ABP9D6R2_9BACT
MKPHLFTGIVGLILLLLFPDIIHTTNAGEPLSEAKAYTKTYQQSISIQGVVTESSGAPLPGVTIRIKGGTSGTVSDVEGRFKLNISQLPQILLFSYIGYDSQEITVQNATTLKVVMREAVGEMDEVVVTAFGLEREKKALGYAVQEVKGDDLLQVRPTNIANSLSGRVAGVQIQGGGTGEGGSPRIVIRGMNSIAGSNDPLVVVDGIPVSGGSRSQASANGGIDYGSGLSDINPDDIKTISVLKGANAAALYGSRAANGVILITTKSGRSRKGIGVHYSLNSMYSSPMVMPAFQNEYGRMLRYQEANSQWVEPADFTSSWGASAMDGRSFVNWKGEETTYDVQENNVQDFFRTGSNNTHSLSLEGGNDKTQARFSFTHNTLKSMIPNSEIQKTNLGLSVNTALSDKLTAKAKVSYILQDAQNRPQLTDHPDNPMYGFLRMPRNIRLEDLQTYEDALGYPILWDGAGGPSQASRNQNPYWTINNNTNDDQRNRLIAMASLHYQATDWLQLMVRGGTDFSSSQKERIVAKWTAFEGGATRSKYYQTMGTGQESNIDFLVTAQKDLMLNGKSISLSGSAGGNLMKSMGRSMSHNGISFLLDDLYNISNTDVQTAGQGFSQKEIQSLYGMAQIGYENMVFLDLTARNDWSSTLPAHNRSYFYPSASLSAVWTDIFKVSSNIFSFAKTRFSWAQVGNDTSPYQMDYYYSIGPTIHGQSYGDKPWTRPNLDLKPEITTSLELGLDIRLFENRLGMDATLYKTGTVNQIISMPVTRTTGYSSIMTNAGLIENKGLEVQLTADILKKKHLEWTMGLNVARNISEVVRLDDLVPVYGLTSASTVKVQAIEGQPYGDIVGTRYARVEEGEFAGEIIVDSKGLPIVNPEPQVIGNFNPDLTGGWSNYLRYKNISLNVLLDFQMGGDIFSLTNVILSREGNAEWTVEGREEWAASEAARKEAGLTPAKWFPTGGITVGVQQEGVDENGTPIYKTNNRAVSPEDYWRSIAADDRIVAEEFLYDASFVKVREVRLTYSLPQRWLKASFLERADIALVGNNLFFLHKNTPGFDPQASYNGRGIEYSAIPTARQMGFNVNLAF